LFALGHAVPCVCVGVACAGSGYKAAEGRKQRKHHLAELKGLLPPSHTPLLATLLLEQHTLFAHQEPAAAAAGGGANAGRQDHQNQQQQQQQEQQQQQQQQQQQELAGFSAAAQEAGGSLWAVCSSQQDWARSRAGACLEDEWGVGS
jgi:hypothetical protein